MTSPPKPAVAEVASNDDIEFDAGSEANGHCRTCNVSNTNANACSMMETDMKRLKAASQDGCQVCGLAFECIAARQEHLGTFERMDQAVTLDLTRLADTVVPENGASETRSLRRFRLNPSFVPNYDNDGQAIKLRPRRVANVFLSLYTRTYQMRDHCRLDSKGTIVDVELVSEPRGISADGRSDQCFQLIKNWIKRCVNEHASCSSSSETPLRTRVLDVGKSIHDKTIRLIETAGQSGKYAALSHCWGGGYVPKTLQYIFQSEEASVKYRRKGFLLSQPSNTFKDAVRISQRLGIQYP